MATLSPKKQLTYAIDLSVTNFANAAPPAVFGNIEIVHYYMAAKQQLYPNERHVTGD